MLIILVILLIIEHPPSYGHHGLRLGLAAQQYTVDDPPME